MRSRRQWSEAFRSLNGIEISSLRPTETIAGRARAGRRRLIPVAKVVPLYDDLYNVYTEGQEGQGERRGEEEDESIGQGSNRHRAGAGRFSGV